MVYSGYELIWLFFVYSFLGWIFETVVAALKQKRFVNKGLVNLPFCVIYGGASVFITIFARELQGIWLYIGSVVLITVFKWVAGHLIEKMYHEKWWDYSDRRWNIEGYVSLIDSALLGIPAVIMMKWGNVLLVNLFDMIPEIIGKMAIWVLIVFLLIDVAVTFIALCEKEHQDENLIKVEHFFTRITSVLSQKIYIGVEKRLKRAYPDKKKSR